MYKKTITSKRYLETENIVICCYRTSWPGPCSEYSFRRIPSSSWSLLIIIKLFKLVIL